MTDYAKKYKGKGGKGDKPSPLVAAVLKTTPPDVEPVLCACDFASVDEVEEAITDAWWQIATDKYLMSKATQLTIPESKLLYNRAVKICTAATMSKNMKSAAEALWMRCFERADLNRRRAEAFRLTPDTPDTNVYGAAKAELSGIYGFNATEWDHIRYFVCQARRDNSDPALNRSLYLYSAEKMTGKTTVARIIAGILNGRKSWRECCGGDAFSDIATELQFERFSRPKATRLACVVMDEAIAGKTTSKYYGKLKTAITTDSCAVEVKFGGTYDVRCTRNYIFTSNNDVSSIIADESERRICVIRMRKPKFCEYEQLFDLWRDYIVNAPDEEDVAKWYRETMPEVRGDDGLAKDEIVSALLGDEFRGHLRIEQGAGAYQVSFPKFFTDWLCKSYDVRKQRNIVKEAVVEAFGEPNTSGRRKYYNITDLMGAGVEQPVFSVEEEEKDEFNNDLPF
jgi:hypothetical protein